MMDADERDIYHYLKSWHGQFVSAREICRRAAGKRRFREDPRWAQPVLTRMVERGILETDGSGHFRLKPIQKQPQKGKRWVSPQVARILEKSGKDFSEVIVVDEPEDQAYEKM